MSSEDEDSHGLLFHGFVPDQDYQPSQAKKVKLDDTSEDLLMDVSARIVQPEETVRSVSIQLERVQVKDRKSLPLQSKEKISISYFFCRPSHVTSVMKSSAVSFILLATRRCITVPPRPSRLKPADSAARHVTRPTLTLKSSRVTKTSVIQNQR